MNRFQSSFGNYNPNQNMENETSQVEKNEQGGIFSGTEQRSSFGSSFGRTFGSRGFGDRESSFGTSNRERTSPFSRLLMNSNSPFSSSYSSSQYSSPFRSRFGTGESAFEGSRYPSPFGGQVFSQGRYYSPNRQMNIGGLANQMNNYNRMFHNSENRMYGSAFGAPGNPGYENQYWQPPYNNQQQPSQFQDPYGNQQQFGPSQFQNQYQSPYANQQQYGSNQTYQDPYASQQQPQAQQYQDPYANQQTQAQQYQDPYANQQQPQAQQYQDPYANQQQPQAQQYQDPYANQQTQAQYQESYANEPSNQTYEEQYIQQPVQEDTNYDYQNQYDQTSYEEQAADDGQTDILDYSEEQLEESFEEPSDPKAKHALYVWSSELEQWDLVGSFKNLKKAEAKKKKMLASKKNNYSEEWFNISPI